MNMKRIKRLLFSAATLLTACVVGSSQPQQTLAASCKEQKTNVGITITASGSYSNWDGVTNVSQFQDGNGEFCFAYDKGKSVYVVKTKNGVPQKEQICLKKKEQRFGAATCDADGYYYVVTGKSNAAGKNAIYLTKYDPKGKMIASTGDDGSSSLAYYYDSSFYTKTPFYAGNCDIAVNGDYVAVNYAREMYSGHQSNSLFVVNRNTMKTVKVNSYYNSHSFAQRVVPYGDCFLLASEGDCYDRAFTISLADAETGSCSSDNSFDFWVEKGTFDRYDMNSLNNNFAHLGGIAAGKDQKAALVATSAKSLSSKAKKENEQLFIQIFDPTKSLRSADAYVTVGKRSGLAGNNGDEKVTNYGVKWLTDYNNSYQIKNPQVVVSPNGNYVILFERYKNQSYQGVCMIVLDGTGKKLGKSVLISKNAYLNPSEMPVYINGKVYWAGNHTKNGNIYVYSIAVK